MWYQGDAITGTSTSGTVFTGSGIENAKLNDMYLNIGIGADRGNVYVCTLAGNASTAQWAYKQNIMGPTGPAGTANASSVAYNNETSGLTADNVQEAVDELNQNMKINKFSGTLSTSSSGNALTEINSSRAIYGCYTTTLNNNNGIQLTMYVSGNSNWYIHAESLGEPFVGDLDVVIYYGQIVQ